MSNRLIQIQQRNEHLQALIHRVTVNSNYLYNANLLLDEQVGFLAEHCQHVLDFGKSSRHRYDLFRPDQITTVDINQFENYPDIIDDICDLQHIQPDSYDGVICMAVLEHVYDPQQAVKNIYNTLHSGGYCLAYLPFLYRYHAPDDFTFQDYFRFTRDGIAYLFRDFASVVLYPYRGPYSTIFNLWEPWKSRIENKRYGPRINQIIDKIGIFLNSKVNHKNQASGYYVWAIK